MSPDRVDWTQVWETVSGEMAPLRTSVARVLDEITNNTNNNAAN